MNINVRNDLIMKSLITDNAGEIYNVVNNNRTYLRKWLPWVDETTSPTVYENVIVSWEEEQKKGTDLILGIFKDNIYVGNIGLHDINRVNNSAMVGYWLAEEAQGECIMTDCVRTLVSYGFASLSLNRIYIYCADRNLKSRAIPERLGFVLEGMLQDGEYLYDKYYDLVVYGMVKRKWGDL